MPAVVTNAACTDDASGNELVLRPPTGNRTTHAWTYENQLRSVALPNGSRTTQTWAPVTRSSDEYRVVQQTSATAFVKHFWDRNKLVLETNNPGTVTAEFTVVPQDYGELASQRRSAATQHYHFDGLGSTAGVSDATQALAATYEYGAFGTLLCSVGDLVANDIAVRVLAHAPPRLWPSRSHRQGD